MPVSFFCHHSGTGREICGQGLSDCRGDHLREIRTDDDTVSRFAFRLPAESERRVLSVATAKSMEFIPIPYLYGDYEVSFFPDGGNLAAGTEVVAGQFRKPAFTPKITE